MMTELQFKIIPDADNLDETNVNQNLGANNNERELDETDESVVNGLTISVWKMSHAFCYSFGKCTASLEIRCASNPANIC